MTTLEDAKQLAHEHIKPYQDFIKKEFPNDTLELEHTTEFDEGWLFFFNSKLFLETHNVIYRYMGLGPVIVGKENSEIYQAGSGSNEELWIEEFRQHLRARGKS